MSTPPPEPPPTGQEPAQPEHLCPRCGGPHDPLQEYCLECGLRLVPLPRAGYTRTVTWSRESPIWLWLALAALLLVALAAGGIVALAATDDDDSSASPGASSGTTTGPSPPPVSVSTLTGESTFTIPPPSTTFSTTGTTTQATTSTGMTATTGSTTTTPTTIISWPDDEDGFTIVLKSTPTSQGRGPADAAAQQAINSGLREVGVLNSSEYSSLNPGYYVTFTGVYDTKSQAEGALPNARSKGFPTAYVREVSD